MTKAEAHRVLDLVRHGAIEASEATINQALALTGDLTPHRQELGLPMSSFLNRGTRVMRFEDFTPELH